MIKLVVPLSTSKNVKYIQYLSTAVKEGKKVSRDPRTISGFEQYDIEIVKVVDDNLVISRPDFQTYGASINKITMSIIGERCTINLAVMDELLRCTDIDEISRRFGDSVEKTLHVCSLLDKEGKSKSKIV